MHGSDAYVTLMELNVLIPGNWWIESESIDENGYTSYKFGFDETSKVIGKSIVRYMEEAEQQLLAPLIGKDIFPAMADMSLAPYWKH